MQILHSSLCVNTFFFQIKLMLHKDLSCGFKYPGSRSMMINGILFPKGLKSEMLSCKKILDSAVWVPFRVYWKYTRLSWVTSSAIGDVSLFNQLFGGLLCLISWTVNLMESFFDLYFTSVSLPCFFSKSFGHSFPVFFATPLFP